MRHISFTVILLLLTVFSYSQFTEDFESGTGSISSTSGTYCNDGGSTGDYFDIGQDADFTGNFSGNSTNFFGAQDIDGCGGNGSTETLTWSGIDISGCTGLSLSVDMAEDDDGSNEDWDASDYMHIDVSIDGGAYQPVIWVENDGSTYNSPPLIDSDFNGTGDGTEITDVFQNFSNAITGTGTTIEIRVTISLGSGDEDIAFDNLSITGSGCGGGGGPSTETNCSDGIDNDGDGDIDCADGDCSGDPSCSGSGGCTDGAIGVTGSGCGCLSGCDLTSLGGPNCSPSVSGNCSSGQTFMSEDISVPAGCTFTVSAEMRVRAGCSASGADGGDQMKVDIVGGSKPYQTGTSNSTQIDSYMLVGPGTIRVSGTANRADEIITYVVSSSGTYCTDCMSTLATELLTFKADPKSNTVDLKWTAVSEIDHDYYIIQRSIDGYAFKDLHQIEAQGSSNKAFHYTTVDQNPYFGLSYYRLKQVDINGNITYSEIRSVEFKGSSKISIFPNPAQHSFNINTKNHEIVSVDVYNTMGQLMTINTIKSEPSLRTYDVTSLSKGTYIVNVKLSNNEIIREKLVIAR